MKRILFLGGVVVLGIGVGLFFFTRHHGPPTSPSDQAMARAGSSTSSPSGADQGELKNTTEGVEVPMEKRQTLGIKTVTAAVQSMKKTLRTVGRVEFDETKLTTVSIKVEGWIEKLYADYAGKYVRKGSPLAEIYSPELLSLQLEFVNLLDMQSNTGIRAQRNIEFSWGDRYGTVGRATAYDLASLLHVARQRFSLWEIPEEQIKELETSKKPVRTMTLKSPATGYVFQKPVFRGTRVAPGDKIFDVVDLSTVWVLADIYEYEIPYVKVGQQAKITLSYFPHEEILARVDFVYPSLSGQTRTAKARFTIPNPKLLLKPQMFANVELELDLGMRLAIPETAVLDTGTRQIVYVDVGDGLFAAREIRTGDRGDGMVEVRSGLKAGEKIAASGVFLIDSEAKLKGVDK